MNRETLATRFYSQESADKAQRLYPNLMVYDGNADEHGRWYWLLGTHIETIHDTILYI